MRTLALFTTLAMMVTACDDTPCLEGVCADHSETRTLPGPCAIGSNRVETVAAGRRFKRCDITYDESNRPASAVCTVYSRFDHESLFESAWTYDATTGELASYESKVAWEDDDTRWTWEPTRVRVEFLNPDRPPALYSLSDRSLFAFSPEPTAVHVFPTTSLGVLSRLDGSMLVDYTWTRAGNRLTQTATAGGTVTTYDLDERGRLVSINNGSITYEYDGDLLVSHAIGGSGVTYTYDAGGNISEIDGPASRKQIFSYDCW